MRKTEKIIALIEKFSQYAGASDHYSQITNVYHTAIGLHNVVQNAAKNKSIDPDVSKTVNDITNSAARLLYNANNYGVSPSTSAKYHGILENSLESLEQYINGKDGVVYSAVNSAIVPFKTALENYIPEGIAAVKPSPKATPGPSYNTNSPLAYLDAVPMGPPTATQNPFIASKNPGPGYSPPEASIVNKTTLPEEQNPYSKTPETIPGPNGGRIPLVNEPPEVGIATDKPFNFGPRPIPAAHLAPETTLPPSEEEKEMEPWEINQADDENNVISIASRMESNYSFDGKKSLIAIAQKFSDLRS